MPVTGGQEAKRAFNKKIDLIANQKMESALTKMSYAIGDASDFYVPRDTGDLLQSRRIVVTQVPTGWQATIGYGYDHTGNYAARLHENNDWNPRRAGDSGKRGALLNASASYNWLNRGADESWAQVKADYRRALKA